MSVLPGSPSDGQPAGGHLSALTLDALALDGLAAEERARATDHLARCERCRGALAAAQGAREHFQQRVFARTVSAIQERARRPAWRHPLVPGLLVPAFAAALALLFLARPPDTPPDIPQRLDPDLRIKGGALLQVFASRDGQVVPVHDGSSLAPGDRVRFVVTPAGMPYLLIASIDGAGTATVYHPHEAHEAHETQAGTESARIEDRARVELPGSIVLDAAPGPERIYALFSREPLAADRVKSLLRAIGARGPQAIRSARTLDIPDAVQASVLIEKAMREKASP